MCLGTITYLVEGGVSLPDDWREKYLAKVNEWEKENSQSSNLFAQNLKTEFFAIKIKIDRLMDGYLEGSFELAEFQEKKNKLMAEKKDIEEKLSDFERKGNHWLELVRNWIIEANQTKNLILSENFSEMKNFLKTVGSNRRLAAGRLAIGFKNPWNYLAEMPAEARGEAPSEANSSVNKLWWTRPDSDRRPQHQSIARCGACLHTAPRTKILWTLPELNW